MKRTALFHQHQASGATFVEHFGWSMPACFSTPGEEAAAVRATVGLADVSYRLKFLSPTQPERHWWRLGEQRYLTVATQPVEPPADATEVTSVYAGLLLAGPATRQVLEKLTALNLNETSLPNLSCAQARVAHVHCIVLREDLPSLPAYHILASRDYAESLWEAIRHAGREFQLRLFGETARQELSA